MSSNESASVSSPVNASPVAPKVNKGKPTEPTKPTVSPLAKGIARSLREMAKTCEAMESAPDYVVPPFDPTEESPMEYATRIGQEAKEHGDSTQANKNAMYKALEEGFRALIIAHDLSKVKRTGGDGTRKQNVILTNEQKEEMKAERAKGTQYSVLAEKYNVSQPTAFNICKGVTVIKGALVAE
jgi:hypothetical protein